jgi:hypothetical protein
MTGFSLLNLPSGGAEGLLEPRRRRYPKTGSRHLPDEVQSFFDWRTLRLVPESYLSDELQRDFADLRFTVRLLGDTVARRITLLFEHKYRSRYRTARQLVSAHQYHAASQCLERTSTGPSAHRTAMMRKDGVSAP